MGVRNPFILFEGNRIFLFLILPWMRKIKGSIFIAFFNHPSFSILFLKNNLEKKREWNFFDQLALIPFLITQFSVFKNKKKGQKEKKTKKRSQKKKKKEISSKVFPGNSFTCFLCLYLEVSNVRYFAIV